MRLEDAVEVERNRGGGVWGETEEGESHLLRRVRLEDAVEVERPQPHVRRHGEHAAWRLVQREHLRHNPTKRRQAEGSQHLGRRLSAQLLQGQ